MITLIITYTELLLFGPFTMFVESCMHIYSVLFALQVGKLTSKKYAKTFNILYAGNKDFVKYQDQGGGNPKTPPCVRPCVVARSTEDLKKRMHISIGPLRKNQLSEGMRLISVF